MAAPTFVAEYETAWNATTSPKTSSATVATNDVLAIFGGTEEGNSTTLNTPTGGGLTYALKQSIVITQYCAAYMWSTVAGSSQSYTLSDTSVAGLGWWGFNALRFTGSDGVGASTKTNVSGAAPSLAITTTQDNSAIAVVVLDWNAVDGASRVWRTGAGAFTEQTYFFNSSHFTVYGGFHADAGSIGTKTVGLSGPAGQKYSIIALEILGSATPTPAAPVYSVSQYGSFH